jgi:hypothetical protein
LIIQEEDKIPKALFWLRKAAASGLKEGIDYLMDGRMILNKSNCGSCDKRLAGELKCCKCKSIYYCGKDFQSSHWRYYRIQCVDKVDGELV